MHTHMYIIKAIRNLHPFVKDSDGSHSYKMKVRSYTITLPPPLHRYTITPLFVPVFSILDMKNIALAQKQQICYIAIFHHVRLCGVIGAQSSHGNGSFNFALNFIIFLSLRISLSGNLFTYESIQIFETSLLSNSIYIFPCR